MSKRRSLSDDPADGISMPPTPSSDNAMASGDQVLAEFTQPNHLNSGEAPRLGARKRQRIEISSNNRSVPTSASLPATAGVIKKITLSNFMCHDHFEVTLGPHINFIIGHNGSGKSAILTAISVCLGATAQETNRGSSLKKLIKNGSTSSRIVIEFENSRTSNCYKHELFGDTIIVQRILKLQGGNRYSIRNESNKQISDKKVVLDEILNLFGITINNPMAILTQDAAKSFIATSSDEEKYKFFMSGTKTDETIKNYHETKEELSRLNQKLASLTDDLKILKKIDSDAKILFDRFESQDELLQMKNLYQGKFFWVQIVEKEKKIKATTDLISDCIEGISTAQDKIEASKKVLEDCKVKNDEITMKIVSNESVIADGELKLKDVMNNELKELKKSIEISKDDLNLTKRELETDLEKLKKIETQIKFEQEKLDQINGGSLELISKEREDAAKKIENLTENLSNLEKKKWKLQDLHADQLQLLREESKNDQRLLSNLKSQLKMIQSSSSSNSNNYGNGFAGPATAAIVSAIERDPDFHSKPIGPLGKYINLKLNEEKWSNLLELSLNRTLNAFIVHDQHDFHRLSKIFRNFKFKSSIIIRKYEVFDFQQGSADSQHFKTILDVLSIDNPFVRCVLVDLNNVNRIVLEEKRDSAESILRSKNRNITSVLVPYDARSGNQLKLNRFGGLQIDVINYRSDTGRLGIDGSSEQRVERLQQSISTVNRRLSSFVERQRKLQEDNNAELLQIDQLMNKVHKEISDLERLVNDLDNKLDDSGGTSRLDSLNEEHVHLQKQIRIKEILLEQSNETYLQLRQSLQELHDRYKKELSRVQGLKSESQRNSDLVARLQEDADTETKLIRHYEKAIEKKQDTKARLELYVEEESGYVASLMENATVCCSREEAQLKEDDTLDSIELDKLKIEAEVMEFEKNIGMTRAEVVQKFEKARTLYETAKSKITDVVELRESLRKSLDDRLMSFEKMRTDICNKVNDSFQKSLMLRQFRGRIHFDFDRHKLTMLVASKKNQKLRNIESFSGGEKSFAQISLLLLIWDFMNTKIRGLDEFDVFMDQVNRTLSLRLILQKIRNSLSQTIFITPLDIAGIDGLDAESVHIHRIADPKSV